jgi:cholesterol transport system auxiliary component
MMLSCTALVGCSGLFHSNEKPDQVYILRATPAGDAAAQPVKASLRVSRPTTAPGLESAQIILVQSDHRMGFYLASRWAARTPDLIETLTVEKLRGSGSWQSVADSTSSFPSDYVMQVMVRHFEADYTGGGAVPDIHVVLDCIVGRRQDREVIANFLAEGSATAAANKLSAVVAAFETATNAAIDSMSTQTLTVVRGAMTHPPAAVVSEP